MWIRLSIRGLLSKSTMESGHGGGCRHAKPERVKTKLNAENGWGRVRRNRR